MQTIIDFMGEEDVWTALVPGVKVCWGEPVESDGSIGLFTGDHWLARKAGHTEFFDPYDRYQKPGTHQFCQTYCIMYLLDILPEPGDYRESTLAALEFITSILRPGKLRRTAIAMARRARSQGPPGTAGRTPQ